MFLAVKELSGFPFSVCLRMLSRSLLRLFFTWTTLASMKMLSTWLLFVLSAAAFSVVDSAGPRIANVSLATPLSSDGVAQPASVDSQIEHEALRGQHRGKSVFAGHKSLITTIFLLGAGTAAAAISFLAWKCFKELGGNGEGANLSSKRKLGDDDSESKENPCGPVAPGAEENKDAQPELDDSMVNNPLRVEMHATELRYITSEVRARKAKLEEQDAMALETRALIEELEQTKQSAAVLFRQYQKALADYFTRKKAAKEREQEDEGLKDVLKNLLELQGQVSSQNSSMYALLDRLMDTEIDWRLRNGIEHEEDDVGFNNWAAWRGGDLGENSVCVRRRKIALGQGHPMHTASVELAKEREKCLETVENEYQAFLVLQSSFFKCRAAAKQQPGDDGLQDALKFALSKLYLQYLRAEEAFKRHEEALDKLNVFEKQWCEERGKGKAPPFGAEFQPDIDDESPVELHSDEDSEQE